MIDQSHDLRIHPELDDAPHERGVFEIPGHPYGWRHWLAFDSQGVIRIDLGMQAKDVDAGLKERMEARLDLLEEKDKANADYLSRTAGALDGGSSSP